jgi:hypothetical protein
MADLALVTAGRLRVVESLEQMTLPTAEAIDAGNSVRLDTTTGRFTKANGSSTGEARIYGVATRTVPAGMPVTAIRKGVLDGYNLDSQAYDAAIYLSNTDGALGDAPGTVSVVVGRVIPASAPTLGTAMDKLLLVHL